MNFFKRFTQWGLMLGAALLIVKGSSQVSDPTFVDLRVGPVAVNAQAVNVALALSVEFPTVGAAYRNAEYVHATEYIGYWDSKACYDYLDQTPGAPLAGEYFYRTGSVDSDGYCNTTGFGTGYSGNVLNYVATSSIDLLRLAITGGDRVADTPTATVLGRARILNWLHNSFNFPTKRIPAALEGKVTPDYPDVASAIVYSGSCRDQVMFGREFSNTNCDNPGTSRNLNKQRRVSTGTITVVVDAGSPAPSDSVFVGSTTTWSITSPLVTATTITTANLDLGHPVSTEPYWVYTGQTTTSVQTTNPPSSTTTHFAYTQWNVLPITSSYTSAPVTGEPVIPFTATATQTVRHYLKADPGGQRRVFELSNSSTQACRNNTSTTADFRGLLQSNGNVTDVASSGTNRCNTGVFTGYPHRRRFSENAAITGFPLTVYEPYDSFNRWRRHAGTTVYNSTENRVGYRVFNGSAKDIYTRTLYATTTVPGLMFARVRVCDSDEALTRTDFQGVKLCQRYSDGNYKPIGELQRRSEGMRVAAFGYIMDNNRPRYGGVLRAPMRFTGPTYRTSSGANAVNSQPEWNVNNGVFLADPLGPTSWGTSGVINYLNSFGRTGSYKTYDPVGELYYEVLRYFQGLPPTADATVNLEANPAWYDNFPVYSTAAVGTRTLAGWVDPIENSCQRRNFILGIGDVNTHNDRQLPGHGGSSPTTVAVTTEDPARGTEPLLGDASKSFNAAFWTQVVGGFESGTSVAYTDALGVSRTTTGTFVVQGGLSNLQTRGTGATNAGYYHAGAAYWANTQPIRFDLKTDGNGKTSTMADIRVKTFFIDVDEGGNGSIVPTRSFLLAGKYGWFNDENKDGNPFIGAGGVRSNKEWQDPDLPGVPDGYVVASQATRMVEGIRKFFSAATSEKGAVSVSSLSSQRYTTNSPDGDLFAPRFDTRDWSGTVQRSKLRLNTATGVIESESGVVWDAGQLLTTGSILKEPAGDASAAIQPAQRNIVSSRVSADGKISGFEFKSSALSEFDSAVMASLNTNPATNVVDGNISKRIDYLRGDRSEEKSSTGGLFRRRNSVMGDIINSGPIFKQGVDPTVSGSGFSSFASNQATRTAVIYVGTNAGMLHGFRATDGRELFAYVPHATSHKLAALTDEGYQKQAYVDAVPNVREAYAKGDWRTVLVSGFGGGANGIFALDVTNPKSFGPSNVMFEFTDQHDPRVGSILTQPKIVKFRVPGTNSFKWYVAFGSGYNNYIADGKASPDRRQYLFILSLDKAAGDSWSEGTNYYRIPVAEAPNDVANALANPGVYEGAFGEALYLYAGDLYGRIWRFGFPNGLSDETAKIAVRGGVASPEPLFTAVDGAGKRQPITTSPLLAPGLDYGLMVVFGTGKFVEPKDADNVDQQTIYGIWDPLTSANAVFALTARGTQMLARTMVDGTTGATVSGASSFTFAISGTGTYRGWRVDFNKSAERMGVEGAIGLGLVAINTTIPEGGCSGDGSGREITLDPYFGTALSTIRQANEAGLLSRPNIVDVSIDKEIYSGRNSTGGRTLKITQQTLSTGTKLTDAGNAVVAGTGTGSTKVTLTLNVGRVSWREIRNFND